MFFDIQNTEADRHAYLKLAIIKVEVYYKNASTREKNSASNQTIIIKQSAQNNLAQISCFPGFNIVH